MFSAVIFQSLPFLYCRRCPVASMVPPSIASNPRCRRPLLSQLHDLATIILSTLFCSDVGHIVVAFCSNHALLCLFFNRPRSCLCCNHLYHSRLCRKLLTTA
ncbi:hypothetical protein BHM03_00059520 [Ensete ventricosum]|nr:hypothetical protein BHM03_00059520 [Ensete ventricosum]